jgi:hypothetical protein
MAAIVMKVLKWAGLVLGGLVLAIALLLLYFLFRPNRAEVDQSLAIETWYAVKDGRHNSNTDLIKWKGDFLLIHAAAPWHFASETTRLALLRSRDARRWERIAEFQNPGEDIRDPHFAVIGGRLFIYYMKNVGFEAEPYFTMYTSSADAVRWEPARSVGQDGWLFWRPETADGRTWYAPAYWHEHGKSILLKSADGRRWDRVSEIYRGDVNDETAILFLPGGRMLATARLEVAGYYFGDNGGNTLIALSDPPYTRWSHRHSSVTRLDGPALFRYREKTYAVGRFQPGARFFPFETGSILARKRTSLFLVEETRLVWLTDLPSSGDTSYAGIVMEGDHLYTCYYTSNAARDYPWVMGMFLPTDIMMAKIGMQSLERIAATKAGR